MSGVLAAAHSLASGKPLMQVRLMAGFERVVYVSCNPETLHANLAGIAGVTHDVVRFAAFDQFPFTHHLETAVYLVRRRSKGPGGADGAADLSQAAF